MPLPAALLPALFLGLLWPGAVRGRPPPGRLPAGPRQRRWDAALFARSVARLPAERHDAARDGDYLLGIKRLRRLYCNVGIGFHIQVLPDGRIDGIHSENRYSKPATTPAAGQARRSAPAEPPEGSSVGAERLTCPGEWPVPKGGWVYGRPRASLKSAAAGSTVGLRPAAPRRVAGARGSEAATDPIGSSGAAPRALGRGSSALLGAALSPCRRQASCVRVASTSGGSAVPWAAHSEQGLGCAQIIPKLEKHLLGT
ncbi:hypothetical protein DV515_00002512 [Chloebia gouldiae]|uniref:Fibroblast growth factor n=1 Tax=Chloebia gouldiae TaxID=44316 RepID=A0A3L8SXQ9_CHLGU|nr:hypothetical protein DV515_00002512 [Chloebia gouldiae]